MHRGRSDTRANGNPNSDASRKFTSKFQPRNLNQKAVNDALRRNSLANANGFANELAKNFVLIAEIPCKWMVVRDKISGAVRVRFRVRFENGNASIFTNFSCEPHGEGKETCLCPSTDRVRFRLFPSTVWAGREYGLDWFRVRFRYPLR